MSKNWNNIWNDDFQPSIQELQDFLQNKLTDEHAHLVEQWMINSEAGQAFNELNEEGLISQDMLQRVANNQWTNRFGSSNGLGGGLIIGGILIGGFLMFNQLVSKPNAPKQDTPIEFHINNQFIDQVVITHEEEDSVTKTVNQFQHEPFSIVQAPKQPENFPKEETQNENPIVKETTRPIEIPTLNVNIETNPHRNITLYNSKIVWIMHFKCIDYSDQYNAIQPILSGTHAEFEEKDPLDSTFPVYEEQYSVHELMKKGLTNLLQRKYKRTAYWLGLILQNYPDDLNAKFYLGMAHYESQNYEKALFYFQDVAESDINVFVEEAEWYLAKTHIARNEKDVARQLLGLIIDYNGFYADQAKDLLKELK